MFGRRRELLERAEELIKSYNPKRTTLESHANEYLMGTKSDSSGAFLKEVFYGVMRCKAALKVFMACFFNDMSARVLRSDYTMYMILAYLSIFRLQELTILEFQKIVLSIDADKMVNFLEYVFDASTLENSGVVSHWTKIFDPDYVRNTLLKNLTLASPAIKAIVNDLHDKSMGLTAAKQASQGNYEEGVSRRNITVAKPPGLTLPIPRQVPEPRAILQAAKASLKVMKCDKTNFAQMERASKPPISTDDTVEGISCAPKLHQTRSTLGHTQGTVEKLKANELNFGKSKASRRIHKPDVVSCVKLNAAAVFREDALFRTKQEQEAAIINAYEAELRDSAEFYQWQMDMRARDQSTRLEQIVRTRTLAKASADEAQQAKSNKLLDNRQIAARGVAESCAMQVQRTLETNMMLLEKRHLVNGVKVKRETAPGIAIKSIWTKNCKLRSNLQHNMKERFNQQKLDNEKRARALTERAKRLKAEHDVHRDHSTFFDPTATGGYGLLDEMSLVEMQERLAKHRRRNGEQCEHRRFELVAAKRAKQDRLIERVENIKSIREAAAAKNHETRGENIERIADIALESRQKENRLLVKLVEDLQSKHKTFLNHRARKNKMSVGNEEQVREHKVHDQLFTGAVRTAKLERRRRLEAMAKHRAIRLKDIHQNEHNISIWRRSKQIVSAHKEKLVKEATKEMVDMQKEVMVEKKKRYNSQRKAHGEKMEAIVDPYTERVNEMSIIRARKHRWAQLAKRDR
mmetsp:Transcript_36660/g.113458  ORF Transcript_36660/g.113458 Transcript_36660/m.113458 type:complete len:747 (-) Transcript_36660:364-2604(-)